jgi:hypothetical protein
LIRGLDTEVLRVFQTIPVNNFGELTKADFNRIMVQLRTRLVAVFGKETSRFNSVMRDLSDIEVSLFQRIFRADTGQRIAVDNASVWAKARNRDIAATGGNMARAERQFMNATINVVENLARRGYADKLDTKDVLNSIRGTQARGFRNGGFARVKSWADSYSTTITQHVGSSAKYETSSNYYDEYDWISILDEVTTQICIDRAYQRYKYGEGPIPPAHYFCRSEIVPVSEGAPARQSFVDWLRGQPGEFLSDVFKAGRRDLDNVKVITLDEFKGKLEFILVG